MKRIITTGLLNRTVSSIAGRAYRACQQVVQGLDQVNVDNYAILYGEIGDEHFDQILADLRRALAAIDAHGLARGLVIADPIGLRGLPWCRPCRCSRYICQCQGSLA